MDKCIQLNGGVYINDLDGNEIVMWDQQEWIDEPELVETIVNAVTLFYQEGPQHIIDRLGKTHIVNGVWL